MFAQTKIFKTPTMKNGKLLLALFATAAIFSSCGSDDDSGSTTGGNIEGKWYYFKEGVASGNQEVLIDYPDHQAGCTKDYVEFVAGGVFNDVDYHNAACEFDNYASTWVKSGNTITLGTGADADAGTIKELTASTLKVSYTETFDGQTSQYVVVYKRQ